MHVMSWWEGARRRPREDVLAGSFSLENARETIAREYGYADWATVEALGEKRVNVRFETALDTMQAGDLLELKNCIEKTPELATTASVFGHKATLLHYLGANGVESHRQHMPLNAAELAKLLISNGADICAEAIMYGGGQTPFALASTSAHPHNAGIADALNLILRHEVS